MPVQRLSTLLHRHDELVHDVVLPLGRVLAHVEVEDRNGLGARGVFHFAQPHFLADKLREFFRTDFAQTLEPRDSGLPLCSKNKLRLFGTKHFVGAYALNSNPDASVRYFNLLG